MARSPHVRAVAVGCLALLWRLVHVLETREALTILTPVLDAEEYAHLAQALLRGQWLEAAARTYVHGPLYAALWATVEWSGAGTTGLRVLQAVLGAITCGLLHDAARRLMPATPALLCGLAAALYAPFILYDGQLLATSLVVFLEVVLLWHLLRCPVARAGDAVATGCLLALLLATRSNTVFLLPVALAWTALQAPAARRRRLLAIILVVVGAALVPLSLLTQGSQRTPIPFQGAWSLYLGTNAQADGTPYARQGLDWQRLEQIGYGGDPAASRAQRGAAYLRASAAFIAEHPGQYVGLLYRKLRLFWHATEVPVSFLWSDAVALSAAARYAPLTFGVVAPLALLGLWLRRRQALAWLPVYGGVAAWMISALLFTVSARYRLPVVPFLLLFAASAVHELVRCVRQRHLRHTAVLAALTATAILITQTGVDRAAVDHIRPAWIRAEVHLRRGEPAAALQQLRLAQQAHPADADVLASLGAAHARLNDLPAAESAYRASLELAPDHSRAALNLSQLLTRTGRLREATSIVNDLLANDVRPGIRHQTWVQAATIALARQDETGALRAYRRALAVQDNPVTRYAMAGLLHRLGRVDEEIEQLRAAVRAQPTFAAAQRNLGALLLQRGQWREAETALQRAIELEPSVAIAHAHLAALYQRTGRPAEAEASMQRARRLRDSP